MILLRRFAATADKSLVRRFATTEDKPLLRRFVATGGTSLLLVVLLAALAQPADAQSRFEIGGGVTWTGGFDAGGLDALETRNPSADTTSPLTLFGTSSRVTGAPGATGRAAFFVSTRVAVEAAIEYSRPSLETTIANDFEHATGTEATATLASYLAGGSVLYHFGGGRIVPFASAGAAWLRQLDADRINAVTGTELHAGGGVKIGLSHHVALRVDAAVSSRDKSLAFENKRRTLPVVGVSMAYRF